MQNAKTTNLFNQIWAQNVGTGTRIFCFSKGQIPTNNGLDPEKLYQPTTSGLAKSGSYIAFIGTNFYNIDKVRSGQDWIRRNLDSRSPHSAV